MFFAVPKFKITENGLIIHNVSQADAKRVYLCRAMDISSPMPDTKLMNIKLKVESKLFALIIKGLYAHKLWLSFNYYFIAVGKVNAQDEIIIINTHDSCLGCLCSETQTSA